MPFTIPSLFAHPSKRASAIGFRGVRADLRSHGATREGRSDHAGGRNGR